MDGFETCLAIVLEHEGGFIDHPKDPGGMTNLGVTRAAWERWTGRSATEAEMRALTPMGVAPLYRREYWQKLGCDALPPALALCVFDFGVNAGPARAARYLQQLAGAHQDGVIGARTLAAVQQFATTWGLTDTVRQYQQSRRNYYRQLKHFATFGRGWLRRVDAVESKALRLATAKQGVC